MSCEFDRLPVRIAKKIELPSDPNGCWKWKGHLRPAKKQLKSLGPVPEPDPRGGRPRGRPRTVSHYWASVRAMPMIHSKQKGYVCSAVREVYSLCYDVPYDDVPVLERCQVDHCVNPLHVQLTARKVPHTGRKAHHGPRPLSSRLQIPQETIMAALKRARPAYFCTPELAAEEANTGIPTAETWAEYLAWDAITPDPNA